MQFYIIAPFLVYAFYRSKRIGMALTGALLLGSILANWIYYASRCARSKCGDGIPIDQRGHSHFATDTL